MKHLMLYVLLGCALLSPGVAHAAETQWQPTYRSTFSSGLDTTVWTRYSGVPRCCSSTLWAPSHVTTSDGIVNLVNSRDPLFGNRWVSAGMSMAHTDQLYGKWAVRFRMDPGDGVGMCIALFASHSWPPEVDFAEESSIYGSRQIETATVHYGASNQEVHGQVGGDFTQWHTMTVVWRPGSIRYLLDGQRWGGTTTGVPDQPMHLIIQTMVGSNGFSGVLPSVFQGPVSLQVKWVHIYRQA